MISNQPAAAFHYHHHHGFDDDDDLTVEASNANSQLGTYLLEGEFDDALSYMDTTEGERDVTARNDPLGLFNDGVVSNKLPKTKNTAIFASLYVRAPLQIIKKICDVSKDADPTDLMYALSVIPHEEEQRLQEIQRKIPYRSRCWSQEEFNAILKLLVECILQQSSGSGWLLEKCPSWILDASAFVLYPLAMAAYNPDVSSSVLQILAAIQPNAIDDMACKLFSVPTIPLIVAAASPAPSSATVSLELNDEVRRNRWEKVTLLMNREWFYEQEKALSPRSMATIDDILLTSPPKLTLHQVKVTCDEAQKRKEWELVRELIKRHKPSNGEESELLSSIQAALAQHDRQVSKRLRKQQEKRVRDEWLHRNMGLVMYPVDIVMDLVYAVIPQRRDTSLVSPMS
ncbi:hypothetical protein ACHAWC_003816 [Mediolabrus comicus]